MEVKFIIGANAYACIRENGVAHDILLSPGKSAQAALREYAESKRKDAARYMADADRAERAAAYLDAKESQ